MRDYTTIKQYGEIELVIKKSRFIGQAARVESESEATEFIRAASRTHMSASCNPYAFYIREGNYAKYSDDGELSGSAGLPVLDVIKKEGLIDAAVVTTRYYGGIKLGAGGLLRAFAQCAHQAIAAAGRLRRAYCDTYEIAVEYALLGRVQNETRLHGGVNTSIQYAEEARVITSIPHGNAAFEKAIQEAAYGRAVILKRAGGIFVDVQQ